MYGLYYKLKNGEDIGIDIQEDENYSKKVIITLFNGGTRFEYDYSNMKVTLNEIIAEIENDYEQLDDEYREFEYRSYAD